MDSIELYNSIRDEIRQGSTRYRVERTVRQLRERIAELRELGNPELAEWLDIFLDREFNLDTYDGCVERIHSLLARYPDRPDPALSALTMLARLTLHTVPYDENRGYRHQALELARRHGRATEELVLTVNWVAAALELGRDDDARTLAEQADALVARLPAADLDTPRAHEAISRLLSHKAKLLLREAGEAEGEARNVRVTDAIGLYAEAIAREAESDHGRTNFQVESADQTLSSFQCIGLPTLSEIDSLLSEAERSLNAHHCTACQGYFHQTRARYHAAAGDIRRRDDLSDAVREWGAALEHGRLCREYYTQVGFPTRVVDAVTEECEAKMTAAALPRKIFLSHKSKDKAMVRDYKQTLVALGLEPWLDEDAMAAGASLQRELLRGMEDSCAAVFFITPNYVDDGYLATEVDYAIEEKRKKGDRFAIVILDFPNKKGERGEVPPLLRRFVWKTPANSLDGLRELLRALPLRLGTPDWR